MLEDVTSQSIKIPFRPWCGNFEYGPKYFHVETLTLGRIQGWTGENQNGQNLIIICYARYQNYSYFRIELSFVRSYLLTLNCHHFEKKTLSRMTWVKMSMNVTYTHAVHKRMSKISGALVLGSNMN